MREDCLDEEADTVLQLAVVGKRTYEALSRTGFDKSCVPLHRSFIEESEKQTDGEERDADKTTGTEDNKDMPEAFRDIAESLLNEMR